MKFLCHMSRHVVCHDIFFFFVFFVLIRSRSLLTSSSPKILFLFKSASGHIDNTKNYNGQSKKLLYRGI